MDAAGPDRTDLDACLAAIDALADEAREAYAAERSKIPGPVNAPLQVHAVERCCDAARQHVRTFLASLKTLPADDIVNGRDWLRRELKSRLPTWPGRWQVIENAIAELGRSDDQT